MAQPRALVQLEEAVRLAGRALASRQARSVEQLTGHLYRTWYAAAPTPQRPVAARTRSDNRPPSRPRTTVGAEDGRRVLVAAGGSRRTPEPSDVWWRTRGPLWTSDVEASGEELVRLYLAPVPQEASKLVALVTAHAMTWDEPWAFRSPTVDGMAIRPDATVLYLPIPSLSRLREDVRTLVRRLRPILQPHTPALTLRIATGAALAQNPQDGSSFGRHRCALIAGAVATGQGLPHHQQVNRAVTALREAGVDPDRPYRTRRFGGWDQAWR